jgi:CRP/FNR family cyclic AMP-dependent transcriptional regulator
LFLRKGMAVQPEVLSSVPRFSLLASDEMAVQAQQVGVRNCAARERVYKMGDGGGQAYVMLSGKVRMTTVDEDQEEVLDEPSTGEFCGFASMLDQTRRDPKFEPGISSARKKTRPRRDG